MTYEYIFDGSYENIDLCNVLLCVHFNINILSNTHNIILYYC